MTNPFATIEHYLSRFATKRGRATLTILLLALGARLAVLRIEPIPAPGVHDEFSYLLMADTFAHGRLTNPTHPMWIHFESMAINQRPTYCSAFYPAQGAFLALGQVVFGHPFWGVWLSTGLMCAAVCWALQGWVPPGWAFLGAILCIARFGVFNYWADSYWGGSVAALGGALVVGGLPRIKRRQRTGDALLMGIGFAILANSRPYEGLVYSLPVLAALLIFIIGRKSTSLRCNLRQIVFPLAAVMTAAFAFMGYYFWRTTGNPIRPPYLVNVETYMQDPQFMWGRTKSSLEYHNQVMADFYGAHHVQLAADAKRHPVATVFKRTFELWAFFIGPVLTVPFFVLGGVLPNGMTFGDLGKTRFLLILLLVSFIGLLLPVPNFPHYAAPSTCAVFALVMQALRRIRVWGRLGDRRGLWLVRAVLTTCICIFLVVTLKMALGSSRERALGLGIPGNTVLSFNLDLGNIKRVQLIHSLRQRGGAYLILVRYRPGHNGGEEWVYNDADIDNSKIVWAREINAAEDAALISYFKDRRILLLDADADPPKLSPYSLRNSPEQLQISAKGTGN